MPTLAPESRYTNLDRSLEAYITEHIVTDLSVPVLFPLHERLEGVVASTVSRWGDVSYMPLAHRLGPMWTGDGYLSIGRYLCNINLFEFEDHLRRGVAGVTYYSLTELADQVCELFPATLGIPIYDYAAMGEPQVGAFEVVEQPTANPIPPQPNRRETQVNVSITLQYNVEVIM